MLGPSEAVSKRVVYPLKRNDKQTLILLIILSDIHCVFFFILSRTARPLLVRCSHKRIKCNCRRVWQRKFLKAHALRASKAKQRKARKKSREGREKRNVEVFDYPRREGIDEDMVRDLGFNEGNKTLSSTPYGQTEYGEKKNGENRQCYESSLDVDETSEMETRSEKNKDEDPQTTPFDQMEVDERRGTDDCSGEQLQDVSSRMRKQSKEAKVYHTDEDNADDYHKESTKSDEEEYSEESNEFAFADNLLF